MSLVLSAPIFTSSNSSRTDRLPGRRPTHSRSGCMHCPSSSSATLKPRGCAALLSKHAWQKASPSQSRHARHAQHACMASPLRVWGPKDTLAAARLGAILRQPDQMCALSSSRGANSVSPRCAVPPKTWHGPGPPSINVWGFHSLLLQGLLSLGGSCHMLLLLLFSSSIVAPGNGSRQELSGLQRAVTYDCVGLGDDVIVIIYKHVAPAAQDFRTSA